MLDQHGVVLEEHGQLTHFSTGDYDADDAPSSSLRVVFDRRRCVPESSQSVSVISSEFESSTTLSYCCTLYLFERVLFEGDC